MITNKKLIRLKKLKDSAEPSASLKDLSEYIFESVCITLYIREFQNKFKIVNWNYNGVFFFQKYKWIHKYLYIIQLICSFIYFNYFWTFIYLSIHFFPASFLAQGVFWHSPTVHVWLMSAWLICLPLFSASCFSACERVSCFRQHCVCIHSVSLQNPCCAWRRADWSKSYCVAQLYAHFVCLLYLIWKKLNYHQSALNKS